MHHQQLDQINKTAATLNDMFTISTELEKPSIHYPDFEPPVEELSLGSIHKSLLEPENRSIVSYGSTVGKLSPLSTETMLAVGTSKTENDNCQLESDRGVIDIEEEDRIIPTEKEAIKTRKQLVHDYLQHPDVDETIPLEVDQTDLSAGNLDEQELKSIQEEHKLFEKPLQEEQKLDQKVETDLKYEEVEPSQTLIHQKSHEQEIKRIEPIEVIPEKPTDSKIVAKLAKILFKEKKSSQTRLAQLYAGFYSLRYNAQEYFGSKFGRRRTPEKRLREDVSEASEIITSDNKQHQTINANREDSFSDIDPHMTPHMYQDAIIERRAGLSDTRNKTDLSNVSQLTKYDDFDRTNVTDRYEDPSHQTSPFAKKLDFADQIDQTHYKNDRLRDSNRYFGKVQLLGKKRKVLKQGKYSKGLLMLQPGPQFPTKLYRLGSRYGPHD